MKMVYRSSLRGSPKDRGHLSKSKEMKRHTSDRGRKLKWNPRCISREDTEAACEFAKTYMTSQRTRKRLQSFYRRFCELNQLSVGEPSSLLSCIGQMRCGGLMYSTINIYVGYITPYVREYLRTTNTATNLQNRTLIDIERACDKAHADEEGSSAVIFDEKELRAFHTFVAESTPTAIIRAFLFVMLVTGWRYADIARLRRRQISFIESKGRNRLLVTAKWTKTITGRAGRRSALFPLRGFALDAEAKFLIDAGEGSEKFLAEVPYWKVLGICKSFRSDCSTYSIRYGFVAWALDYCDGDVKEVARRFTLHRDETMLNAFYISWREKIQHLERSRPG